MSCLIILVIYLNFNISIIDEYIYKTALPILKRVNDEAIVIKPTKVSLVKVPEGTTIRQSVARPQDWPGQGHTAGGAAQFEIRGDYEEDWYQIIGNFNDLIK